MLLMIQETQRLDPWSSGLGRFFTGLPGPGIQKLLPEVLFWGVTKLGAL